MGIAYFCIQVQFWFPIWVIFLLDRGLTLGQIVIADIIYWGAVVLFEFPMGAISDKIGRRRTYFFAAMFGAMAYFIMLLIQGFGLLILSWLMWAIYIATISGTDNAYIYELSVTAGLQDRTKHVFGYFTGIQYAAIFLSVLFAGYFYIFDPNLPIALNSGLAVISGLVVLTLPTVNVRVKHQPANILRQVQTYMRDNASVRQYVILIAVNYVFIWTATLLYQPLLVDLGIAIQHFGWIFAAFPLTAMIGGIFSGRLSDWWGTPFHMGFGTVLIVISMIAIGVLPGPLAIVGIICLQLAYSLLQPVFLDSLNTELQNETRASVLSFANLLGSLGLMISRPTFVYFSDITSTQHAYAIWGGLGIGLIFLMTYFLRTSRQS